MNIEDLTKTQLVFLMLLITFVTSIATTIATYTLLGATPTSVTSVINRVIERTIEKNPIEDTVTPVQPVLVSEQDKLLAVIAKYKNAVVTVASSVNTDSYTGTVLDTSGHVAMVDVLNFTNPFTVTINKEIYDTTYVRTEGDLALYRILPKPGIAFTAVPLPIISSRSPQIGEVVLFLGPQGTFINKGTVTKIIGENNSQTFETTVLLTAELTGLPIFGLDGKLLGFVDHDTLHMPMIQNLSKLTELLQP